jgi:hypothetical protein
MTDRRTGFHAEMSQPLVVPPGSVSARRLSHHQYSSHPQERRRALCRHGRRSKTPGHYEVDRVPENPPASLLGSLGHHLHPVGQAEPVYGLPKERSPVGPALQKYPGGVRPSQGERETGQPSAAAKVNRRGGSD